jgi:hypothetical protein
MLSGLKLHDNFHQGSKADQIYGEKLNLRRGTGFKGYGNNAKVRGKLLRFDQVEKRRRCKNKKIDLGGHE